MPGGYLQLVAIIGLYTLLVLWPPRRPRGTRVRALLRQPSGQRASGLALGALLTGTVLALIGAHPISAGDMVVLALAALTALGLLEVIRRGLHDSAGGRGVARPRARPRLALAARPAAGHAGVAWCATCSPRCRCARRTFSGSGTSPTARRGRRNRLDVYRPRGSGRGCAAGVDPLPWRPLSDGRQEPRGAPAAAPARQPRLGLHQRQLPARCRPAGSPTR